MADFIGFSQYFDLSLTMSHYRIGRGMHDTGEVGSFGYWLAFFQFLGFAVGGFAVFGFLSSKPVCPTCEFYLRPLSKKKEKTFADSSEAIPYYDTLFDTPVDGPEFAEKIRADAKATVTKGALHIETVLLGCPSCKQQLIEEKVQIYNGSE